MLRLILLLNHLTAKIRLAECGFKTTIRAPLCCSYKFIKIGTDSHIKHYGRIEAISKWNASTFDPLLSIGSRVSIQQNVHITFAGHLEIGDGCLIAPRVTITDIHHSTTGDVSYPSDRKITVRETKIGKGVFIGANAVVLPGTNIGDFATIGANQVVSGKIPCRTVVK